MMDESGHQSVPWLSTELAQFQPCSELSYKKGSSQQLDLANFPTFCSFSSHASDENAVQHLTG